ncbi:MAG TPA: LPP20 family lipoprotein [Candidatus Cloacimonadota bacterium]|nr:LPP20 family lipoprotein [Candidatus Cloacimonadota bacterium]
MNIRLCLSILIAGCLLSGLAAEAKRPVWLSNPYQLFPEDEYICGTGGGADLEAAKIQALGDISRYFESQVTAYVQTTETESSQSVNGQSTTTLGSDYQAQVKVFSDVQLEYAVLADSWTDPETKLVYVLMTIEKLKLRAKYLERVNSSEQAIGQHLKVQGNPFQRYSALLKATRLMPDLLRDCNFYNTLISSGAPRLQASLSEASLQALIAEARAAIVFDISVPDDPQGSIATTLQTAIQKMGFGFGPSALKMDVRMAPTENKQLGKQYFVGYEAVLTLSHEGTQIFVTKESSKQGDVDEGSARNRTLKALSSGLANKFTRELNNYIEGL